ncbi:hypothetical protein QBC40DRAFT_161103, partial [Triangularia verruculosa]
DGSTCAETANSTDCLLRLVLAALEQQKTDAGEEYNWDPITFVFTATIGIIAAFLALLTIYQAVIASGPGRRKSSRRAIGPWADKTKTEWSWRDFNSLSVATTPVLRAEDLLDMARRPPDDKIHLGKERHPGFDTMAGTASPLKHSATWLRFLEHVNLDTTVFETSLIETTLADYLPSDLLAVPAYAEVGLLTAVAASARAHSLFTASEPSSQSAYPIVNGKDFQFDFRQHPLLGIV